MVGAANNRPSPPGGPSAPNEATSSATRRASVRDSARPYAFVGSVGADQPASPRRSHHSATVMSGSQFSLSQSRISWATLSELCVGSSTWVMPVPFRTVRWIGWDPPLASVPRTATPRCTYTCSLLNPRSAPVGRARELSPGHRGEPLVRAAVAPALTPGRVGVPGGSIASRGARWPPLGHLGHDGVMILEHAVLDVHEGQAAEFEASFVKAKPIISGSPGFRSLRL